MIIHGTDDDDDLQGTIEADFIFAFAGLDLVRGGDGNDNRSGGDGDDTIYGGNGNDRLFGGAGNDTLIGGDGVNDSPNAWNSAVYDVSSWTTAVRFPDWPVGWNPVKFSNGNWLPDGQGGTDTLIQIFGIEVYGGSAADTLAGARIDGWGLFALLEGNGGDDLISAPWGNTTVGFDTARSDLGIDRIIDFGHQDRILLRDFDWDFVTPLSVGDGTGVGEGQVQFGAFDETTFTTRVYVGTDHVAGADLVFDLSGQYQLSQFSRNDAGPDAYLLMDEGDSEPPPQPNLAGAITGTRSADTLTGTAGGDTILGGSGSDIIEGLAGADYIDGEAGNDKLYGGDGNDKLLGSQGRDRLEGGNGHDVLAGGEGDDMIWGHWGEDWLQGDAGNDRLTGGDGNDMLVGGAGSDILIGNLGRDTFWFQDGSGTDRLEFFWVHHGDRVRIDADVNGSGILTGADAYARVTDTVDGALLDLGGGNNVLFVGVAQQTLGAWTFEVV